MKTKNEAVKLWEQFREEMNTLDFADEECTFYKQDDVWNLIDKYEELMRQIKDSMTKDELTAQLDRIIVQLIANENGSGACGEMLGIYTRALLDMAAKLYNLFSSSHYFCYVDTDSVKVAYRGGFTHVNPVKEDPDET